MRHLINLPLVTLLLAGNVLAQNATPATQPAPTAALPVQKADVAAPKMDAKTGAPRRDS